MKLNDILGNNTKRKQKKSKNNVKDENTIVKNDKINQSIDNIKMKIFEAYTTYNDQFHEYYQQKYIDEIDNVIERRYDGILPKDINRLRKSLKKIDTNLFNANVDKYVLSRFDIDGEIKVNKINSQLSEEIFDAALNYSPIELFSLLNNYLSTNFNFDPELMNIIEEVEK